MSILHTLKSLLPALVLLLATDCNSDVFIDEFLPEPPAPISLTEEACEATVSFEADNWDLWSVETIRSDLFISDEEGNGLSLPIVDGGSDYSIVCRNTFVDFRIEKRNSRTLALNLHENLLDSPIELTLRVGNEYELQPIDITLQPTGKYRIDSIVYDWNKFEYYDNNVEQVDWLTIHNQQGTSPVYWTCYPYRESKRKVHFALPSYSEVEEAQLTYYLGSPRPAVPIPDVVNGQPVMGDSEATFSLFEQRLDASLDKNFSVQVEADAGKATNIQVYNALDVYNVPFSFYASHPRTGKRLELHGTLRNESPRDYLIIKKDVTDELP